MFFVPSAVPNRADMPFLVEFAGLTDNPIPYFMLKH